MNQNGFVGHSGFVDEFVRDRKVDIDEFERGVIDVDVKVGNVAVGAFFLHELSRTNVRLSTVTVHYAYDAFDA